MNPAPLITTRRLVSWALTAAILTLCAMMCTSCTIKPFVVTSPNGTQTASLGGSVMTKSDREVSSIEMVNGTVIKYDTTNNDETVVPVQGIKSKTTLGLGEQTVKLGNTAVNKLVK